MPGIRPAQATLIDIRNGKLLEELSIEIHDAVAAVRHLGKAAKVTITLEIKPQSKNVIDPIITITGEVESKLPKPDVAATIFAIDEDGNPTRNLSRAQSDLGLTVAGETKNAS